MASRLKDLLNSKSERERDDSARFNAEGVTKIKKNGKWGLINKEGKIIVPCEYEEIRF